jgi:hypothetical protein
MPSGWYKLTVSQSQCRRHTSCLNKVAACYVFFYLRLFGSFSFAENVSNAVVQLVEAAMESLEFFIDLILPVALCP